MLHAIQFKIMKWTIKKIFILNSGINVFRLDNGQYLPDSIFMNILKLLLNLRAPLALQTIMQASTETFCFLNQRARAQPP